VENVSTYRNISYANMENIIIIFHVLLFNSYSHGILSCSSQSQCGKPNKHKLIYPYSDQEANHVNDPYVEGYCDRYSVPRRNRKPFVVSNFFGRFPMM